MENVVRRLVRIVAETTPGISPRASTGYFTASIVTDLLSRSGFAEAFLCPSMVTVLSAIMSGEVKPMSECVMDSTAT